MPKVPALPPTLCGGLCPYSSPLLTGYANNLTHEPEMARDFVYGILIKSMLRVNLVRAFQCHYTPFHCRMASPRARLGSISESKDVNCLA